jgi:hypothetical protein
MTKTELAQHALALPIEEQLDLEQEIWEHAFPPSDLRLSDDLRGLLKERRAEALAHPEEVVPREEARVRLLDLLATWEPLDEEFPEIDDCWVPTVS